MTSSSRDYSPLDRLLIHADSALTTIFGTPSGTGRPNPAAEVAENDLSEAQKSEAESLMRVNHVGEVCAQALYQAQAITSRSEHTRQNMQQASEEENDHLIWCEQRLEQLGGRKSYLNPLWYSGAFAIGAAAGLAGDRWNLGFVAETERQVVSHLDSHLKRLPEEDLKSRAIVEQMKQDEGEHATMAVTAGASELPGPVKSLMKYASRVMTRLAHHI